jgi:hypothetical protein
MNDAPVMASTYLLMFLALLTLERLVRIPTQTGHPFRFKAATCSDPFRPGIPKHSGHPLSEG